MVLTLGGRSYLNAFVTEENAVPLSLPASSPAPPRLALLSLARLIADRVFARPLDYPERDCEKSITNVDLKFPMLSELKDSST